MTITTDDGRKLTLTERAGSVIRLTDGRVDYLAVPNHRTAGQWTFTPAAMSSRKPGGHFTIAAA
jgi:hypothetical protein